MTESVSEPTPEEGPRSKNQKAGFLTQIFSRVTAPSQESYILSRRIFLRGLGLVYLTAFLSLWIQWEGLLGSDGILPVQSFLERADSQLGDARFWQVPTLFWIRADDAFIGLVLMGGMVFSVLAVIGVMPVFSFAFLWISYLSLCSVGQSFLSFQWDILLLEIGFIAVFFSPFCIFLDSRKNSAPSRLLLWVYRWLLFRLMFVSGLVKLMSGDPLWKSLTALQYHYETQPLPTRWAWYSHQLPDEFQKFSVVLMFAIEIVVPFLIFLTRRLRMVAAFSFIGLMLVIGISGNYCFFNILTVLLCFALLDDDLLRRWIPLKFRNRFRFQPGLVRSPQLRLVWNTLLGGILILMGWLVLFNQVTGGKMPRSIMPILQICSPFRLVNGYGLFAVMTPTRPEIRVEGSFDGVEWKAYEFKWKPGALDQAPRWVQPHQPRLDWQMWFAALGDFRSPQNRWFIRFAEKLLQGAPSVTGLLHHNPFPDRPPVYIRAVVEDYHFTTVESRRATGNWWEREVARSYMPAVSLTSRQ
jgi:uncharacterized membrane protein YphA (DoxX/SURF4 family)